MGNNNNKTSKIVSNCDTLNITSNYNTFKTIPLCVINIMVSYIDFKSTDFKDKAYPEWFKSKFYPDEIKSEIYPKKINMWNNNSQDNTCKEILVNEDRKFIVPSTTIINHGGIRNYYFKV